MNSENHSARPSVLVLLATFNGERWLPKQIDTLLSQRDVEVSFYISDDASTDETWKQLGIGFANLSGVHLFRQVTSSGSAGANFRKMFESVDLTGYDFVALADQDDEWHPYKLSRAIQQLLSHHCSAYSGAVEAFWPGGRTAVLAQSSVPTDADFLFEGAGQGCTFVIEVGLFRRIQEFCRSNRSITSRLHYHDWLVYVLARAWSQRWLFDAWPYIRYRQHSSNELGARSGIRALTQRLALMRSGWYRAQIIAAADIYIAAGGSDVRTKELIDRLKSGFGSSAGLRSRAKLAGELMINSRRRRLDRILLTFIALAGWI